MIVLLHDSLGSVAQWRDFPRELEAATGQECFAYDRRGHGATSAHEAPFDLAFIEAEARYLVDHVLREHDIARAVFYGHSVGGCIATIAAALAPERCVALITEGAQAFVEEEPTLKGVRAAVAEAPSKGTVEKLRRYHGDKAQTVFDAWTKGWLAPGVGSWSLAPWLPRITAPTLVMHGDRDEYGSVRHPQMIASGVSGPSRLEILPGIGHFPHRECREMVLDLVTGFLRSESARPRPPSPR